MASGPPLARTPLPTRQRRTGWTALGGVLVIGIGAAPRAVQPVRRCRVGNGVRATDGPLAIAAPLVETCGRSTPFTVRVGVFT